jgi:Uncharacterized conserved protein (DUF2285)/Family of unknown function (DUF6499)
VKALVGGVLSMPQVRITGTAWERRLDDYAYTMGLDGPGWAWEFLRRNQQFLADCRLSKAGTPIAIKHVSGALLLRPRRRFLRAESWGLLAFPNPQKSSFDTPVFWSSDALKHHVNGTTSHANDNDDQGLSLQDFAGQRLVLAANNIENLIVRSAQESARLSLRGHSILFGKRNCVFHIEGLSRATRVAETLRTLRKLRDQIAPTVSHQNQFEVHLRDYLVALDGHLAGRSYRDIAEVIYGPERVKNVSGRSRSS